MCIAKTYGTDIKKNGATNFIRRHGKISASSIAPVDTSWQVKAVPLGWKTGFDAVTDVSNSLLKISYAALNIMT